MEPLGAFVGRMSRRFKVALCGYYGFGNLGDELLAEALIKLLEEEGISKEEMVLLSSLPGVSERKFAVKSVKRDNLIALWNILKQTESLLLGGGGLFQDVTSFRSCFYYWGVVRIAELAGCKIWAFGNSIGPLRRSISKYLTADAYKKCNFIAVRDQKALKWIEGRGLKGCLAPDPVLYLWEDSTPSCLEARNHILVNFRPWGGVLERRGAEAVERFARKKKLNITGVALSEEDVDCMNCLSKEGVIDIKEIKTVTTLEEAIGVMKCGRAAVGMRLHFCVLSLMAGLAPTAIPYDPKVREFAKEWGLPVWEPENVLKVVPRESDTIGNKLAVAKKEIKTAMKRAVNEIIR